MEKIPFESCDVPSAADFLAWQTLLRHETLRLVKNVTFTQLVSCPELADILKESTAMNRDLLELLHNRFSGSAEIQ
ncbi:hypothetical protein [Paenibacillus sp.]|jgi:hypothetical protein|uniref:hypothetical protein n=1 Tax=Paenibacillus sp. TaxID=58172 RepID=UPI0028199219|nr:hypothetical protein [Paenibacillus sp.]MDR0270118.1 hypothetical protein [Paenibacillus sp.]